MEVYNFLLIVPFKRGCPSKSQWHLAWDQDIEHTKDMELNRSITSERRLGVLCLGVADLDPTVICFQQSGLCLCYKNPCGRPGGKGALNPSPDNPFL